MKKYALLLLLAMAASTSFAQVKDTVKHWTKGAFFSLAFNQVSLTNWKKGGENALSGTILTSFFANYKTDKMNWENNLTMSYGLMKTEGTDLRKNEDKIDLNSKFGYVAYKKLFYSALLNFKTQFYNGYDYSKSPELLVSKFMAPAYLTIAIGLDFKPFDYLSFFISPATGRFTFVLDQGLADIGAYGVEKGYYKGTEWVNGKQFRPEFGAYFTAKFQKDVFKFMNIFSKIDIFNNYTDNNKGKDYDNRKYVDVNWETMINIKAGKFITTSLYTNLIYDRDVSEDVQFKEVFGVGFSYKF